MPSVQPMRAYLPSGFGIDDRDVELARQAVRERRISRYRQRAAQDRPLFDAEPPLPIMQHCGEYIDMLA